MDEKNIAIAMQWFVEFWGNGDYSIVDNIAAENVLLSYPLMGELRGRESLKENIKCFHRCFLNNCFQPIGNIIVGDNRIAVRWKADAVYAGMFGGLPQANGKKIKIHFTGISIVHVVEGKILEDVGEEDRLTLVKQIRSIAEMGVVE